MWVFLIHLLCVTWLDPGFHSEGTIQYVTRFAVPVGESSSEAAYVVICGSGVEAWFSWSSAQGLTRLLLVRAVISPEVQSSSNLFVGRVIFN